jgi:hypothetical protein
VQVDHPGRGLLVRRAIVAAWLALYCVAFFVAWIAYLLTH